MGSPPVGFSACCPTILTRIARFNAGVARFAKVQLVIYRNNWGEDRVYFYRPDGELSSVPALWTNLVAEDPFVSVAAGRSLFRLDDLLKLAELIAAAQR